MKAIVCVKRVIDYNVKIRVKSDNSGVETENVKMSMNPFDEIAVEEAVKMKERNEIDEIVVVSIGSSSSQETIRSGLAMGGDRGIHVITDESLEPLAVAKILSKIIEKESPKIVFLGKQAIDDDSNQTGQMLSAISGFSQATFASKVIKKENFLEVTREIDGGLETIKISLPSIVTTDLRLNEPRYASLPNIMKARQKKIDNINIEDLNVDVKSRLTILKVNDPPERKAGVMVKDIDELVDKLKNEAKVL
ncbi:MAG: electron transfer flavoprotein subunit beta [Rickettsiales bacterium]|nr:electron transfer flavoprotein subunit beta [Rickettsiales bacterium]OUV54527.1 MAG: electron transfer flavoprotein subunit beta [Rickettsiales bacterium TMED127]|tara:strand:- start:51203 stop:51952 length:750 start_codon:yes stop_codon:yes gene_type:complete